MPARADDACLARAAPILHGACGAAPRVAGQRARLAPAIAQLKCETSLAGWRLRFLDGNHFPASQKRLARLSDQRSAALPGHTLVIYDPDQALGTDIVGWEDAYKSERTVARTLVASPQGASYGWLTAVIAPAL